MRLIFLSLPSFFQAFGCSHCIPRKRSIILQLSGGVAHGEADNPEKKRAGQIGLRGDKNTPGPAGTAGGTVTKSKMMSGAALRDFARESP